MEKFINDTDSILAEVRGIEKLQNDFCVKVHRELKELLGNDKMIVLDRPVKTYGDYESFTEIAVCDGILMSNNKNGWCDKPVQPYHAHFYYFFSIALKISSGEYKVVDNPIKNDKSVWSI